MQTLIRTTQEAPLLMSAKHLQAMGISRSMAYELLNMKDFPVIIIGNRKLVPKDMFIKWMDDHVQTANGNFVIG